MNKVVHRLIQTGVRIIGSSGIENNIELSYELILHREDNPHVDVNAFP